VVSVLGGAVALSRRAAIRPRDLQERQ
jgi:hypothetical protein